MPKDYSKGKIYTIRSRSCDLVYIGSTIQTLPDRLSNHYANYKQFKKGNACNCTSYQILERGDAYIELFEYYPCNSREELERHEGQCQRKYECVNLYIAGRTKAEWREENKKQLNEKKKKWAQNNKEKVAKQKKKWAKNNKEKLAEKDKKYYEDNRGKILEKKKKWREENKEILTEKITCDVCGSTFQKREFKRHERSQKHIKALVKC